MHKSIVWSRVQILALHNMSLQSFADDSCIVIQCINSLPLQVRLQFSTDRENVSLLFMVTK